MQRKMLKLFSMKEGYIPGIVGLGAAEGKRRVSNNDIAHILGKPEAVIQRLMKSIGIEERNWVDENLATSDLAIEALRNGLVMSGVDPVDLKSIKVATMSSDYQGVPVGPKVAEKVGTPKTGNYHDVGAACAGFIYALYEVYTNLDSRYGLGGPQAAIGADVLSRHINPTNKDTYVLFGDGAGVAIVDMVKDQNSLGKHISFVFGADGSHASDLLIPAGGSKQPATAQTTAKNLHSLKMNGQIVRENAINRMSEAVELVIQKAGIGYGDVLLLIPHQANLEIIKGMAKKLGLADDKVYKNIHRYGNTSAASIPTAMRDAHLEGRLEPDNLVVLTSFGAGFIWGAAVLPTTGLPKRNLIKGEITRAKRALFGKAQISAP